MSEPEKTLPERTVPRILRRYKRDQRVRRLSRRARKLLPWIEEADGPAVKAWAELEVLASLTYDRLRSEGILNSEGEPKTLLESYQRLRKTQLSFEKELGMTPAARMALKANSRKSDFDLAAAMTADAEATEDGE
jgi:hypothetical protein